MNPDDYPRPPEWGPIVGKTLGKGILFAQVHTCPFTSKSFKY